MSIAEFETEQTETQPALEGTQVARTAPAGKGKAATGGKTAAIKAISGGKGQVVDTGKTPAQLRKEAEAEAKKKDKELAAANVAASKKVEEERKAKVEEERKASRLILDAKKEEARIKKEALTKEKEERQKKKDEFLALTTESAYTVRELTEDEKKRREELETVAFDSISLANANGLKAAMAIEQIIREGLHHDYSSAGAYAEARFGISRQAANRQIFFGKIANERILINSKVIEDDSEAEPIYYQFPTTEAVARPLNSLGDTKKAHKVWDRIVAKCKSQSNKDGKIVKPTMAIVQREVDEEKGKGQKAIGMDAELEARNAKLGKNADGTPLWRANPTLLLYVDYKGRRYQTEKLSPTLFKASILELAASGFPVSELNSRTCPTHEAALAFWETEKQAFDGAEDAAFGGENATLPTPEYFIPPAGVQTITTGSVVSSSISAAEAEGEQVQPWDK